MTDETLFAAALEAPDRAAFLAHACPDAVQRARVERLLAAHDRATGFLRTPAAPPRDPLPTAPHAPADDADDALGFLSPSQRPDSLGRIGQYEVLEILGRGGFGIVYRAFDDVLQRVVAVKVLAPAMAATSAARKRFLREARSSAAIRHENIVQVHAVVEHPLPHIVMEFVPGESLQQRLDRAGPLDVPEVLRIGRQVADGLAAAHAAGVVHRDIKPANVLVEPGSGRIRITDFGLARAADDASLTRSGVVAGTPMYMAPEQAKGETLDHRADLFSLGSVLYALLTGRPPFRADSTLAVLKRVTEDTPRPMREVIPEVPEWLCRVVGKLHAKAPDDRYPTAREVADVLADCEQQLAAHKELKDFSRIPGGRPRRRRRVWRVALYAASFLLLALAVVFGGGVVLYARDRGEIELAADALGDEAVIVSPAGREYTTWYLKPRRTLTLPAGKYTVRTATAARARVVWWQSTNIWPFHSRVGADWERHWNAVRVELFGGVPSHGRRATGLVFDIDLRRGERVVLCPAVTHIGPPPSPPAPASPPEPEPVLLKRFDPATDTPTLPWGDPKNVRPEDGGWRIENATSKGNFHAHLGTLTADLPTEGLVVFKAKVRVKANDKVTWGSLRLGIGGPNFHGHDWQEELGTYRGDVPEWTQKELQYPASVFHKRELAEIPVYVGLYSNGVVWVKDAEVWHIPVDARRASILNPLRDAVKAANAARDLTKKRYEAGVVSKIDLLRADGNVIWARVAYAEAEGDANAVTSRLVDLVKAIQEERDLVDTRVKAGVELADTLISADARLAAARARLAKATPRGNP